MTAQVVQTGEPFYPAGSGSGATTFTSLTDVPASYAGGAAKVVRVNAGETGLEFAAGSVDPGQSTSLSQISSSLSGAISSNSSLSSAVSTVDSGQASSITSLSTAISTVDGNQSTSLSQVSSSLSGAISSTSSLSTAVSTVDSNESTSLSQISSSLSGAISSAVSLPHTVTFDITGGAAAGTVFDATVAKTIDYSTVGAQPNAPRIQTVASASTVTPTFSNDQVNITALAAACQLLNPTGTAVPAFGLVVRIKDNGTARALTYDTQYRAIGVSLPSTTVISKTLYLGMIYNSTDTRWDVVAVAQEA